MNAQCEMQSMNLCLSFSFERAWYACINIASSVAAIILSMGRLIVITVAFARYSMYIGVARSMRFFFVKFIGDGKHDNRHVAGILSSLDAVYCRWSLIDGLICLHFVPQHLREWRASNGLAHRGVWTKLLDPSLRRWMNWTQTNERSAEAKAWCSLWTAKIY